MTIYPKFKTLIYLWIEEHKFLTKLCTHMNNINLLCFKCLLNVTNFKFSTGGFFYKVEHKAHK